MKLGSGLHDLGEGRAQGRALLHHAAGHVKNNTGLLPVGRAAVYLAAVFIIATSKKERDGGGKL
jgi:hypothetical protein